MYNRKLSGQHQTFSRSYWSAKLGSGMLFHSVLATEQIIVLVGSAFCLSHQNSAVCPGRLQKRADRKKYPLGKHRESILYLKEAVTFVIAANRFGGFFYACLHLCRHLYCHRLWLRRLICYALVLRESVNVRKSNATNTIKLPLNCWQLNHQLLNG